MGLDYFGRYDECSPNLKCASPECSGFHAELLRCYERRRIFSDQGYRKKIIHHPIFLRWHGDDIGKHAFAGSQYQSLFPKWRKSIYYYQCDRYIKQK